MTLAALRVHTTYGVQAECVQMALHRSSTHCFLRRKSGFCAHFDHPTIITCEKAVYVYTQLCIINHAAYVYGSNIYGGKYVGLVVNFRVNPRENTENSVNKRLLAIKPARPCYSFLYRLLDS